MNCPEIVFTRLQITDCLSLCDGFPELQFTQKVNGLITVLAAACLLPYLLWSPSETRSVKRWGSLSSVSVKIICVISVSLSTPYLGSYPVRKFMLAMEPDHERPGGVALSWYEGVGTDRGSVFQFWHRPGQSTFHAGVACQECFFGWSHGGTCPCDTPCRVQFEVLPPRECLHPPLHWRSQCDSPLWQRPGQSTLHAGTACQECFLCKSHSKMCSWETPWRVQFDVVPPQECFHPSLHWRCEGFMLAVEPDHERPGGETLSGYKCVGSDRGSVCVGCEGDGEVGKWTSTWPNGNNREGGWNMDEGECFAQDSCDMILDPTRVCVLHKKRACWLTMTNNNEKKVCVWKVVLCTPPSRTWQSPLSGRETTKKNLNKIFCESETGFSHSTKKKMVASCITSRCQYALLLR